MKVREVCERVELLLGKLAALRRAIDRRDELVGELEELLSSDVEVAPPARNPLSVRLEVGREIPSTPELELLRRVDRPREALGRRLVSVVLKELSLSKDAIYADLIWRYDDGVEFYSYHGLHFGSESLGDLVVFALLLDGDVLDRLAGEVEKENRELAQLLGELEELARRLRAEQR